MKHMNEEFRETISKMVGYPVDISFKQTLEEDGILHSDVIALMKCKRLERIADASERIADSLEALTECVGYIPPLPYQVEGVHFIRIGGSVDTE